MGGSGSRATADGPARCEALALPSSAHQSQLVRAHRYAMFFRRAWRRLRKASPAAAAPYATPPAVRNGLEEGSTASTKQEAPSARTASFMGAMSSGAEERIRWRRAGPDRRRGWGFRKLKTRSDSAVSSPEGVVAASPNKLPTDVAAAGTCSEGTSRGTATAGPNVAATTAAVAPAVDDYSCLAEDDDINWSAGYVKLCCMADALSQDCNSFQDLRKGADHAAAATVQSELVVERLESVEQRVNLRDGRSAFGASGERISCIRKTKSQVVTDGNTTMSTRRELAYEVANVAAPVEELLLFDPSENTSAGVKGRATIQHSGTERLGPNKSPEQDTTEDGASIAVRVRDQYQTQVGETSIVPSGLSPEPVETRRCGSASPKRNCPVGLLIQPHQQHQQHWGNDHANAGVINYDSLFSNGSFLQALQHSPPPCSFPPPHPPASSQRFWCVDRGSLENYAERGDFSMTWSTARDCSGSMASSEDSVFAHRASTASRHRGRSFDEGEVADIFMFSDDDEDLCSATDRASGSSLKPGNNQFEVGLGVRERGAGPQQRPLENGSGDNTMRRIELVVHT